MADISIQLANQNELSRWDEFVMASVNGSIFHKRGFLEYHQEKFKQTERFLSVRKGQELIGLLPLSIDKDSGLAKSPYGASYGGFVFEKQPSYSTSKSIIDALLKYFKEEHVREFIITPSLPLCSYPFISDSFSFALLESGFVSLNRDVCSVVHLPRDVSIDSIVTSNARNMVRKAEKAGLIICHDVSLNIYWPVMEETFSAHGAKPTHSLENLDFLIRAYPQKIRIHACLHGDVPVAGLCEFEINKTLNSSFYFCQVPKFDHMQGLSLLIFDALKRSAAQGYEYYDFGTSSVGMQARPNIFRFKESFGARGVFRETFKWSSRT